MFDIQVQRVLKLHIVCAYKDSANLNTIFLELAHRGIATHITACGPKYIGDGHVDRNQYEWKGDLHLDNITTSCETEDLVGFLKTHFDLQIPETQLSISNG